MSLFESRHFTVEPLAPGVFAAIHRDGGWAIGNAGIVDVGNGALVFDAFMTPAAATDLRAAAETLTGGPVRYVVNSHYHNDHIWGNQVFAAETLVISSRATRRLIQTLGQEEVAYFEAQTPGRLQELEAQADADPASLDYYRGLAATLPGLAVRLPDLTFAARLDLHAGGRALALHAFDDGHTGNDAVLHLPDDGILFMADLLFVGCHPYLADGDPENLQTILEIITRFEATTLVPGHGPVGGPADLARQRAYIEECLQLALALRGKGDREAAVAATPVPAPYEAWALPGFFQANLNFLVQRSPAP